MECPLTAAGILCGECEAGYGVGLLESECREFSGVNNYYWLVPILSEYRRLERNGDQALLEIISIITRVFPLQFCL